MKSPLSLSQIWTHTGRSFWIAVLLLPLLAPWATQAQDGTASELDEMEAIVEIDDPLGILPEMQVDSVFGLGKRILDTPRSISVVTGDMIGQYGIRSVNDVVTVTPGAFTSSFFGIDGAINLRGTIAETYFRGIKRIKNPGNYPTPIAASQRIDIVRGPTPPTFGEGVISGYLNFVPKSARAATGRYLDGVTGSVSLSMGSWDYYNFEAELGGPMEVGGRPAGYYTYFQALDSKSYYNNVYRKQQVFQASFDFSLSDTVRVEAGTMIQRFEGTENAGWNRITQELIDNGTYYQGRGINYDTDGDGFTSGRELYAADPFPGGAFFQPLYRFVGVGIGGPGQAIFGSLPAAAALDTNDPFTGQTTTLSRRQVLVDGSDIGKANPYLFYVDFVAELSVDATLTNKSYFERLPDRFKYASYGLSQLMDVWVFENKTLLEHSVTTDFMRMNNQYALSVRRYDVESKGDFWFEFFDRRDLSRGPSAADRILTAYQNENESFWSSQEDSRIDSLGLGVISDMTFGESLNLLLGARIDFIDARTDGYEFNDTAFNQQPFVALPTTRNESGSDEALSLNASLSYDFGNVIPYITWAQSETLNTDQAGLLNVDRYTTPGALLNEQELREVGVKMELLEGRLYGAAAYFRQETSTVANFDRQESPAALAKGFEFELRWVPTKQFSLIATLSNMEVENAPATNSQFNFFNLASTGFDPVQLYGGVATGNLDGPAFPQKPQVPEWVGSLVGTYVLENGLGLTAGISHIDSVNSDRIGTIVLPSATLLNLGAFYSYENWRFSAQVKNATDERWFRGNFGTLFGGVTVLPELPRNWEISASYAF